MPADQPPPAPPVPSVWTRPHRRRREQPALSRELIVSEAVRLLDAEGLDALSMRNLGARLDAGATSLYSHVASKDELIELVVDEVYGEIEVPDPDDPARWREAAIRCARSVRSAILRHPWIVPLLGEAGLAYLGPNTMRLSEHLLALFETAGFPAREADQAGSTVIAYVIGVGTTEAAWLTTLARSGQSERDWIDSLRPAAEQAAQAYPRLREAYTATASADTDPQQTRDENFGYGLERVLDGLEVRLARTGGGPTPGTRCP